MPEFFARLPPLPAAKTLLAVLLVCDPQPVVVVHSEMEHNTPALQSLHTEVLFTASVGRCRSISLERHRSIQVVTISAPFGLIVVGAVYYEKEVMELPVEYRDYTKM
eukprot:3643622-Rhodomonas_salina.1